MVTIREERTCGECIACCVLLTIESEELQKPAGAGCPNCTGKSCAIYDSRPGVCRTYLCGWRWSSHLEDDARPDMLRVMFHFSRDPEAKDPLARFYVLGIPFDAFPDYSAEPVQRAISRLSRERIPIWMKWGRIRRCVHPSEEIRSALARPQSECDPRLLKEVEAWRAALAQTALEQAD